MERAEALAAVRGGRQMLHLLLDLHMPCNAPLIGGVVLHQTPAWDVSACCAVMGHRSKPGEDIDRSRRA